VHKAASFLALNDLIHHDFLAAVEIAEPSLTAFDVGRDAPND
jgi:hypothetical protein